MSSTRFGLAFVLSVFSPREGSVNICRHEEYVSKPAYQGSLASRKAR